MEGDLFQHLRRAIATVACVVGVFFAVRICQLLFGWQSPNLDPGDAAPGVIGAGEFHLLPDFDWPEPERGSRDVDLFSPPTVELKRGKPTKWHGSVNLPTTQFQLLRLEELPYHLQLDGFVEEADGALRLFLRDSRTGSVLALRQGESAEGGGPTILRWEWETQGRSLRVFLWDSDDETERCLRMGSRTMSGNYRVEIRAETNGGVTLHRLSSIGQSFPLPGGDCMLVAVDPERKCVSLQPPTGPMVEVGLGGTR
ncbi:MAG: hypothetical protein LBT98_03530 [Puniceicoccales bacterium]|jgi:hypothetical protein|nr:hypothetical protein [Puniceicoccales bacterium]